jgi:predicted Zn-dependent peptidase
MIDNHVFRSLLDNPVFDDAETSQEAAEILQEFIKLKTNNNDMV